MAFVSSRDEKMRSSDINFQEEFAPKSSFGDVYATSIGQTFDEELSISSKLNREGWSDRKRIVEGLIDSGALDKSKYSRSSLPTPSSLGGLHSAQFDYEAASLDFEEIKDHKTLSEERNQLLKMRRDYANDVFERGSGTARFLGAATAFMLDPISIATMPIGYSVGAAKGLRAVGKAALKIGATEMAVETGIQAFVFDHKEEIDSPYGYQDAITNIGTAALGSALLGGTAMGIKEYISHVRLKTKDLPDSEQLQFADETLARLEETLSHNPLRKEKVINDAEYKGFDVDTVYYHGTSNEFDEFDIKKMGSSTDPGIRGKGFYFSPNKKTAESYGSILKSTHLKLEKPIDLLSFKSKNELAEYLDISIDILTERVDSLPSGDVRSIKVLPAHSGQFTSAVKSKGHDSIIHGQETIVFDPAQIRKVKPKSMTSKELINADKEYLAELEVQRTRFENPKEPPPAIEVKNISGKLAGVKDKSEAVDWVYANTKEKLTAQQAGNIANDRLMEKGFSGLKVEDQIVIFDKKFLSDGSLKTPKEGVPVEMDGKMYDSNQFISEIDTELKGIDSIMRCLYK